MLGGICVPSQQHEILVEMFRNRPQLACELLEQVAGVAVAGGTVALAPNDLSQAIAVEYRADAVIAIRDEHDTPTLAIIVEVQIHVDTDKRMTWPLYIAALRARLRCDVLLLVFSPHQPVARWARAAIQLGHPGFVLEPIVVELGELPRVTDPVAVRRAPELAVLSVMAHRDLELARVVAPEMLVQPEPMRQVYLDLIYSVLPEAAERALKELLMEKYQYQSNVVREYIAQGRAEGREEGREEGLRRAILEFARAKIGTLPPSYEQALHVVATEAALSDVIAELGKARDATEIHAVFTRLLDRLDDTPGT
ncbi:MAG TPA: hypothetical protein VIV11_05390 [Kofleriaceae bacterium]